jgi:acyl carrier protein
VTPAGDDNDKGETAMSTTYDALVELLVEKFEADREKIRPEVTFDELDMDSLFLVELLLVAQAEFGVKIDENVATPRDTVGHAAEAIHQLIVAGAVTS